MMPHKAALDPVGRSQMLYRHHWLSLGLIPREYLAYSAAAYKSIEAADNAVIGIPKQGKHYTILGNAPTRREAEVIATILRFMMPG